MSNFTVIVVDGSPKVTTTTEELNIDVCPTAEPIIEVVAPVSEITVSEQTTSIEIVQEEAFTIEVVATVGTSCCDVSDLDIPALTITKTYSESISALELVVASSSSEVEVSEPSTYNNSKVMGVAIQAGAALFNGKIHILGILNDPSFTFPVNDVLFLGVNGEITTTVPVLPTSAFSQTIGYSLGTGAIFVQIGEPIAL